MAETYDACQEEGSDMDAPKMLQPGQTIRPIMTTDVAVQLAQKLYGLHVVEITELTRYDDKNYYIKVLETHKNPHIEVIWPHGYVLKVLNSMESKKTHVDAQHEALHILHKNGIQCPLPVLNVNGKLKSLEKIYHSSKDGMEEQTYGLHIVRLFTFIPGRVIAEVPSSPQLMYQVGNMAASIDKILMGWSHPALMSYKTVWGLEMMPEVRKFMHVIQDESRKAQLEEIISAFEQTVLPKSHLFQRGVIHGDTNDRNWLVRKSESSQNDSHELAAVLDLGDMQNSCYVYELALTVVYMMIGEYQFNPLDVGGHVLAGYLQKMSLTAVEKNVLKVCVAARFVQSLVYGAYTYQQDPSNMTALHSARKGWSIMKLLWETPQEELYARWMQVMEEYRTQ